MMGAFFNYLKLFSPCLSEEKVEEHSPTQAMRCAQFLSVLYTNY